MGSFDKTDVQALVVALVIAAVAVGVIVSFGFYLYPHGVNLSGS